MSFLELMEKAKTQDRSLEKEILSRHSGLSDKDRAAIDEREKKKRTLEAIKNAAQKLTTDLSLPPPISGVPKKASSKEKDRGKDRGDHSRDDREHKKKPLPSSEHSIQVEKKKVLSFQELMNQAKDINLKATVDLKREREKDLEDHSSKRAKLSETERNGRQSSKKDSHLSDASTRAKSLDSRPVKDTARNENKNRTSQSKDDGLPRSRSSDPRLSINSKTPSLSQPMKLSSKPNPIPNNSRNPLPSKNATLSLPSKGKVSKGMPELIPIIPKERDRTTVEDALEIAKLRRLGMKKTSDAPISSKRDDRLSSSSSSVSDKKPRAVAEPVRGSSASKAEPSKTPKRPSLGKDRHLAETRDSLRESREARPKQTDNRQERVKDKKVAYDRMSARDSPPPVSKAQSQSIKPKKRIREEDILADHDFVEKNASLLIRQMFNYKPDRYKDVYSDDDSDMEAGFSHVAKEESRSLRLARKEDEEEERKEMERRRKKGKL
ncbi:hypothetical protein HDU97_000056 [Phlyctochytrium planicorne]|nr:hypothetical protein HDU97_000056 [Phlyctochytrium planicorne]